MASISLKPGQSCRNLALFLYILIRRHPLFSLHLSSFPRQQNYNHGQLHFHVAQRHHLLGHHDQCLAVDPPHLCPHGRAGPGQTGRCPRRRSRQQRRTKPLTSSRTRQPEKAGLKSTKLISDLEGRAPPVRRANEKEKETHSVFLLSAGKPLLVSLFPEQPWRPDPFEPKIPTTTATTQYPHSNIPYHQEPLLQSLIKRP